VVFVRPPGDRDARLILKQRLVTPGRADFERTLCVAAEANFPPFNFVGDELKTLLLTLGFESDIRGCSF
jgi:hypothetical protein